MSVVADLKRYLSERNVRFWTFSEMDVKRSSNGRIISSAHESMVRPVILRINNQYVVMILEHSEEVDLEKMKYLLNVKSIQPVLDKDYERLFPGCEQSLLPLSRNFYNLRIYCSRKIMMRENICLNICTTGEMIKLSVDDFLKLAKPTIGSFTRPAAKVFEKNKANQRQDMVIEV